MRRATLLAAIAVVCGVVPAACGDDIGRDARSGVTSVVVSDETTRDISVSAPTAKGPWPVILVMHGIGGTGQDMAELGSHLARGGAVVFAPTYHTDWSTEEGLAQAARDAECGYRFSRSIAPRYGGDLDQPVTFVGWSLGATAVLALGLTDDIDPSGEIVRCFENVPRADVIVAISGCYYEYEGAKVGIDSSGWANTDARVVLVAAGKDTTCAAWQSERAAAELRSRGYDVRLVRLEDATHLAPVFLALREGKTVPVEDDPSGDRVVEVILDEIAAARDGS
jgi:dienelactone hydrolase